MVFLTRCSAVALTLVWFSSTAKPQTSSTATQTSTLSVTQLASNTQETADRVEVSVPQSAGAEGGVSTQPGGKIQSALSTQPSDGKQDAAAGKDALPAKSVDGKPAAPTPPVKQGDAVGQQNAQQNTISDQINNVTAIKKALSADSDLDFSLVVGIASLIVVSGSTDYSSTENLHCDWNNERGHITQLSQLGGLRFRSSFWG